MNISFLPSRRRHTRYWRDWSSDVCSSDLGQVEDDRELELAPEPLEQVAIQDVADLGDQAASGHLVGDGAGVDAHDVVDALGRELTDQAVPDLASRPGHEYHRLARHARVSRVEHSRARRPPDARCKGPTPGGGSAPASL